MSTPFARTYAPTDYRRSPVRPGVLVTSAPPRHAHWTLARGLGVAAQVLFFAVTAGKLTSAQLIVSEIAACVLALGAGEALKSAVSVAHPQRTRYGRGLSEVGIQCAVVVLIVWLATH